MKQAAIFFFALAAAAFLASEIQSEPKRTDPRYAAVIGTQLKYRIDFLFAPSDSLRDEPELVKRVILPAMGLASYDDGGRQSN